MKLAFFDDFKLGVVAGDKVVDVTDVVKDAAIGKWCGIRERARFFSLARPRP